MSLPVSFAHKCRLYSLDKKISLTTPDSYIMTDIVGSNKITLSVLNGYFNVTIPYDKLKIVSDGTSCSVSVTFTLFNFPLTLSPGNYCEPCATVCNKPYWSIGGADNLST
ncbi:hypothetical protein YASMINEVIRUS_1006 [Yasminevirus sp. GU-2018]|uniref:Uncharacterized protein n=1 Tax=Yasminevirus sp. GU-2018 TaxID=2420051 RepID=A0A5K0UAQ3_9VIRU|nr:hypothetical protein YASMINEVIRUS_1006 [Yasminevirus sp. GU-2018]